MNEIKGRQLLVNLGASQVRKRLKHFGHGVKKVRAVDRGQAVVIHTASGEHRRELEALFDDVGCAEEEAQLGVPIESVRNLGRQSAQWLQEVGVLTKEDLQSRGAVLVYRLVKRNHAAVTLNLLWALAAGLQDRDFRDLTTEEKEQLLHEVNR